MLGTVSMGATERGRIQIFYGAEVRVLFMPYLLSPVPPINGCKINLKTWENNNFVWPFFFCWFEILDLVLKKLLKSAKKEIYKFSNRGTWGSWPYDNNVRQCFTRACTDRNTALCIGKTFYLRVERLSPVNASVSHGANSIYPVDISPVHDAFCLFFRRVLIAYSIFRSHLYGYP